MNKGILNLISITESIGHRRNKVQMLNTIRKAKMCEVLTLTDLKLLISACNNYIASNLFCVKEVTKERDRVLAKLEDSSLWSM